MKLFKKFVAFSMAMTMAFSAIPIGAYATELPVAASQSESGFGSAGTTLSKGEYTVPVSLMNASNISNPSMANSCVVGGSLVVAEDGSAKVSVDLQAVSVFGITAWASDWKIFKENKASGETFDTTAHTNADGNVDMITFDILDNTLDGVYTSMYVSAMNTTMQAYFAIDYAKAVKVDKPITYGSAGTVLEAGTYSLPVSLMNASNISNPSMAGSCVAGGSLVVAEDGSAKVSVDLQAVSVFGITAWASDWKIFKENQANGETFDTVAHTNADGNVDMITFDVLDNTLDGAYTSMYVSAMNTTMQAYFALDYANAVKAAEFGSEKISLLPGTYSMPLSMMNAGNIANPSMAASCINGNAEIMVCKDGTAMVTVNLQPATAFGLTLSASDWKVYQGSDTSSELLTVARHNSAGSVNQIKFTLPDNTFDGTYVNMFIAAPMNTTQNAYFAMDFASCEKISNTTAETSTPIYYDGKGEITVSVPKVEDGKWIHKVGVNVDTNDSELINYTEKETTYDFIADITADSYGNDTVNYESYYIYNYEDGDFSSEIGAGNYKSSDEDNSSGDDPKQLYKKVLNESTITFKEAK